MIGCRKVCFLLFFSRFRVLLFCFRRSQARFLYKARLSECRYFDNIAVIEGAFLSITFPVTPKPVLLVVMFIQPAKSFI